MRTSATWTTFLLIRCVYAVTPLFNLDIRAAGGTHSQETRLVLPLTQASRQITLRFNLCLKCHTARRFHRQRKRKE